MILVYLCRKGIKIKHFKGKKHQCKYLVVLFKNALKVDFINLYDLNFVNRNVERKVTRFVTRSDICRKF